MIQHSMTIHYSDYLKRRFCPDFCSNWVILSCWRRIQEYQQTNNNKITLKQCRLSRQWIYFRVEFDCVFQDRVLLNIILSYYCMNWEEDIGCNLIGTYYRQCSTLNHFCIRFLLYTRTPHPRPIEIHHLKILAFN